MRLFRAGLSLFFISVWVAGVPLVNSMAQSRLDQKVSNGSSVFSQSCASCHYTSSTGNKVGPGLKGYFRTHKPRPSDEQVREVIEHGKGTMPSFPNLDTVQVNALIAYLRTL